MMGCIWGGTPSERSCILEICSISVGAEGFSLAFTNVARGLFSLWKIFSLPEGGAGNSD